MVRLVRQDDYGNRYCIRHYRDVRAALAEQDRMESGHPHKQWYSVESMPQGRCDLPGVHALHDDGRP